MPKMFVHTREGSLDADARALVEAALTELGTGCEHLADTPDVRRGVWVFFAEHAGDQLFQGGEIASEPVACVVVFALQSGLGGAARHRLIAGITAMLGEHIAAGGGPAPVYVAIQDVPETSWGIYGEQVSLASLRAGRGGPIGCRAHRGCSRSHRADESLTTAPLSSVRMPISTAHGGAA